MTERPGYLRLYGNCYDLSWPEAPALLLRKQSSYTETFHATLQFNPTQTGYEAGIVLWWSQYSYASIGVTLFQLPDGSQARTLLCRAPSAAAGLPRQSAPLLEEAEASKVAEVSETASLKIEASPTAYKLSVKSGESNHEFSVSAEDLTIMPPIGGSFCGTMFGIYSFGKGEPVLDPADFTDISVAEGGRGVKSEGKVV